LKRDTQYEIELLKKKQKDAQERTETLNNAEQLDLILRRLEKEAKDQAEINEAQEKEIADIRT